MRIPEGKIFRLLRDAAFSESDFWSRRRGTISKYSNMKHMFEKYVRNDIGGWSFFLWKLLPWMLFFYIYYISIFWGVGGVVKLYFTLLTRKKVEWKCFRLSLKYIPILKFSLDKGNKVRKQKIRGRARPCKLNRMAFLPNKMEASSVSFSSTSTTNSKFKLAKSNC